MFDAYQTYITRETLRKIAIIGTGLAALYLANKLLKSQYDVTLISDKTPEEILNGPPTGATYYLTMQ
ncbi:hypothetical protein SAMN05443550_101637 [Pedobacter hartonius]|uniref:Uncharacterized protein n=1 Tax=Pedobacter hartonius TaxID=425514 RepID=A0A1H3XJJ6_9SPHI|nr:hypothetical protein SAMN05443550_101637 [Pedobacter hartonius]